MNLFPPEILGVLAIWMLAVVSPGPAFLVLSQLAAGRSRSAALGASLGIAVGATIFASLTMWGLAVVVTQIAWFGTVLRIAGAVYLVYLGLTIFHHASVQGSPETMKPRGGDVLAGFRIGLLTALTNPKAIAFFLSLFAVALPPHMPGGEKLALLAAGFVIELSWYVLVAFALSTGWLRAKYARARATIDRVLGSGLVLVGVRLGTEK